VARRPSLAIVAALLLAGAAPSLAQAPEMPMGKWWRRPGVVEQLKIKPDQQERLDEIFSKNRRSFIDLKADVERRGVDLEELLAKKDTDPARIAPATDALEQAKARLGKARTMMIVEMKGVMSEEQWQKILDYREQWRRDRMDERRGAGNSQRAQPRGPGAKGALPQPTAAPALKD
jgi:Spy/CpxP family protein refolding chaperone